MKKGSITLGVIACAGLIGVAASARADFSLFVGRPGFGLFPGDPVPVRPPVIYAQPYGYYAPPVYGWRRHHHKHHWRHWKKHRGGHHGHHGRHHHHDD